MLLLFLCCFGLALSAPSHNNAFKLLRGNCPMFWYNFNGHCYKYVASHVIWADAELYCVSEGANLVSIHSIEEHNFVNTLIRNFDPSQKFTWNGLSDIHKEGNWMWSDGSEVNFFLWDPAQPDNGLNVEHCGHTNFGSEMKWNDYTCNANIPFVCKSRTICP